MSTRKVVMVSSTVRDLEDYRDMISSLPPEENTATGLSQLQHLVDLRSFSVQVPIQRTWINSK